MKKTTALILCAVLLLTVLAACGKAESAQPEATPVPTEEPVPSPEAGEERAEPEVDYEALIRETYDRLDHARTTWPSDTVVYTVDGRDVTWGVFYYFIYDTLSRTVLYYSPSLPEDFDYVLSDGTTLGQTLIDSSVMQSKFYAVAEEKLSELGLSLTQADEDDISAAWDELMARYGSEEELTEDLGLDRDSVFRILRGQTTVNRVVEEIFGADGEKIPAEDIVAWAEDQGYVRAKHILFYFYGEDGLPLDEAGRAEKLSRAEEVLAELKALESDPDALEARFNELMTAHSEDPGVESYPNGYTFTNEAAMYPEFKEAAFALENFGLSDIVETQVGYHILLRLPLDAEEATLGDSSGDASPLRTLMVSDRFMDWIDAASVEWVDGFEDLDLNALFALPGTEE